MTNEKMRELKAYESELLQEGNTYSFARLVLELHPEICEEAEFTFADAVNRYQVRTEFCNDIEAIYTLRGQNGIKYFFDSKMQFRGVKF